MEKCHLTNVAVSKVDVSGRTQTAHAFMAPKKIHDAPEEPPGQVTQPSGPTCLVVICAAGLDAHAIRDQLAATLDQYHDL
jgi:hypothetical protein